MKNIKYKVLLVEDNEIERHAFERFVKNNEISYDYVIAKSVSEAQRELACKKFDIVISDHDLGDGTAIDVLHFAKDIPVVVVTGAGDEETAIRTWKAGAYDYLVKDLDQNYLRAIPITVENAIKHKFVEDKLQLLSGAVRSTEDSVYITNMCGEIIFVNKAFCKTYGYSEEEIMGKNSSILWIGKNQSENTRSVFQTRSVSGGWEVGFYHKRKDDSIFPISLSRSTIKDANKRDVAIVGVARDISERLLIEDELRSTSMKLQKRIQTQNEIAITAAEAIQRLLAEGKINKASKVICDFLDVSKINAGAAELNCTNFDFTDLVSSVKDLLSSFTSGKNIEIKCSAAGRQCAVNADYDKMAQVLINLLLVGIRFSPQNNNIDIVINNTGSEIAVEIHSAGCDFENNKIYKNANNSEWIKQQFDSGREDIALGLRVAREFIEMHGGRIGAERRRPVKQESNQRQDFASQERADTGNVLFFTIPKINSMFLQAEGVEEQKNLLKMTPANI
ncbi:MAG: PAS domain S-box protein [Sedimentisphaerales bacterium]|nr:PAS domain S-box protein [Sedimentisphaerales bacterium]